jgi:hypothetical protein
MGLFDAYSQSSFKTLRDGRMAFHPHLAGRGYMVSADQRAVLRRYMIGAAICSPVLGVMGAEASRLWNYPINIILIILVLSLFAAGNYSGLWWLTRNLERAPADERLTLRGRYRTQAQHLGWASLWFLEIGSGICVVVGLLIAATADDAYALSAGLAGAVFFGLCAWAGGYMLWVKSSKPL